MSDVLPTLTAQELQAAYLTPYDLGPGYPQLAVPPYVHRLYLDTTADDISLRFPPVWTPEKQAHVDADLDFSVRQFLAIPASSVNSVRVTFSGSIALDRALSATQLIARRHGPRPLTVVTTTPSIDIMKYFLEERAEVLPVFMESKSRDELAALDLDRLVDAIKTARNVNKSCAVAVLLCSPENPTGAVWSLDALKDIAAECAAADATLILDHCFAVAGVHLPANIPRVWDLPANTCRWVAIWDTGKTFGLNEDKLGFIITDSDEMCRAVDQSLNVLQFGVSRRAKLFFSELLQKAIVFDHVGELRALCSKNYEALATLSNMAQGRPIKLLRTQAGSLALLDIHATGLCDESVRMRLLSKGIGVVAGNVFFHTDWKPNRYIRVALARRPDYFQEAIDRVWGAIS
jgi:aspartate/methionine/tyrosine aminotransferase